MKRVLITGAAGNLGGKLAQHLRGRYALRLLDQRADAAQAVIGADLSQWDKNWVGQFEGVDVVVHLAANPNPTPPWADLVAPNLDAVVNVYNAAAQAGVKRVVFASSNHAMGAYKELDEPQLITVDAPPRPGTRWEQADKSHDSTPYGALKLVGERVGQGFATAYGMSVVNVRIGWVMPGENGAGAISAAVGEWARLMWLSNRDYCQLMERAIAVELATGATVTVNGMSNNRGMRWDLTTARDVLGYAPEDDVTRS